ncbi:deoxyribonuclease II family protein [Marinicella sediminis]|nr:deoxyribonuclease II family protein [Marinicella sediminis]
MEDWGDSTINAGNVTQIPIYSTTDEQHMISVKKDKSGEDIDWWFIYKLPKSAGNISKTDPTEAGYQYLYFDANSKQLRLSQKLLTDPQSAVELTLAQIDQTQIPDSVGWFYYNDEIPEQVLGNGHDDGSKGHTKGLIMFDTATDTALWLLHSTPRWPLPGNTRFPDDERIYGQTMLAITLKDLKTAELLAAQMLAQQQPQVYSPRLPDTLSANSPIRSLVNAKTWPKTKTPSVLPFHSRAGESFTCYAKNRAWDDDFWIDLVAHDLKITADVETWRRGTLPGVNDFDDDGHAKDIQFVTLKNLGIDSEWKYTHDHSKWGIAEKTPLVFVADINRQTSQEKRGGGAIGFRNNSLWQALQGIELFSNPDQD